MRVRWPRREEDRVLVPVICFGAAVLEHLEDANGGDRARVVRIGLPDRYVTHGKPALIRAEVGLNPTNDGRVIRIPVPSLTQERRKELVKKAHDMAEHSRTGVRQARREGNDKLKKMEKDKEISQDDERRGLEEIQKLHDRYIGQIAHALDTKEKDILAV